MKHSKLSVTGTDSSPNLPKPKRESRIVGRRRRCRVRNDPMRARMRIQVFSTLIFEGNKGFIDSDETIHDGGTTYRVRRAQHFSVSSQHYFNRCVLF